MDPEIKAKWLTALRSGEYMQGRGTLRIHTNDESDPDRFCCLGVLCDLAERAGAVTHQFGVSDENDETSTFYGVDGASAYLPDEVITWATINTDAVTMRWCFSDDRSLTHMNDTGSSFSEIADVIEREF